MDDFYHLMTSEKLCALIDQFGPVRQEAVSLKEALGRITAEEITSPHDLPEFNRATMDGYAVRARDSFGAAEAVPALFSVVGEVHMGAPAGVDVGAEVFVRHGFKLLAAGDLVSTDGRRTITLEIFLMNSFMEAVAVYSAFFPNLGLPAEMGAASSAAGNTIAFVKGRHFIRVFLTSGEGDLHAVLDKIAGTVAGRLSENPSLPSEAAWFQAVRPRSVKYIPDKIWGLESLGAGFTAELNLPAGEMSLFLSRCPSREAAIEAGQGCRRKLGDSCSNELGPIPIKAGIVVCVDDPSRGRMVILRKGPYLAGAPSSRILFDLNPLRVLLRQVPE
ncbi:MAG: hypothetical protein HQK58_11425 [Deltaproteobacteria bacterium]|nr:hypothetical protein [Deltaproteobacteria bacterium]